VTVWRIDIETCPGDAARDLLARLLGSGSLAAALVPMESTGGSRIEPCLVTSEGSLEKARPFAPYFFGNRALAASRLTRLGEMPGLTAVLLRPCETRSLVELKKLRQVSDENLVTICLDCAGTLPAADYRKKKAAGFEFHAPLSKAFREGRDLEGAREACSICLHPSLETEVDIAAGLFGLDGGVLFIPVSRRGEELLGRLQLPEARLEDMNSRREAIEKLKAGRRRRREEWLADLPFREGGAAALAKHFDACEQCRACSEICPVCYCKQCAFKLAAMETEPENSFLRALGMKKIPVPFSALFFHLGRMTHMAHACTGCGACTEACPAGVEVARAFIAAGSDVQKLFGYEPGRSREEKPPLTVFNEDEFEEVVR
jgi:formate dehydrogenase subunit beta